MFALELSQEFCTDAAFVFSPTVGPRCQTPLAHSSHGRKGKLSAGGFRRKSRNGFVVTPVTQKFIQIMQKSQMKCVIPATAKTTCYHNSAYSTAGAPGREEKPSIPAKPAGAGTESLPEAREQ